jgi:hypothetical protein
VILIAEATVIESGFDAEAPAASITWTVKFEGPAVVGVPVIAPLAPVRVRPAGSAPEVMDHVSGVVPPVAASD